jgi:hypothetical protein
MHSCSPARCWAPRRRQRCAAVPSRSARQRPRRRAFTSQSAQTHHRCMPHPQVPTASHHHAPSCTPADLQGQGPGGAGAPEAGSAAARAAGGACARGVVGRAVGCSSVRHTQASDDGRACGTLQCQHGGGNQPGRPAAGQAVLGPVSRLLRARACATRRLSLAGAGVWQGLHRPHAAGARTGGWTCSCGQRGLQRVCCPQ